MLLKLIFILGFVLFTGQAWAGAAVTYHGRILKPDGSALDSSNVIFKIQVRSPGTPSCLLYEETRSLDMHSSSGIFAIPIGDGAGTRTGLDPAITIENVFSNNTTLNFTSLSCNSGTSYNPSPLDSRRLVVSFDDGSGAGVQTLAGMDINFVPLALHAYEAQSALKVGSTPAANVMTVSGPASALTPSNFTELLALVNGTSTVYAKTSSGVGGDLSGTIASASVVKLQGRAVSSSVPSTNDVLTWNGTSWAPAAGGGGGAVSSVAGRTGVVVLAHTDISGLGDSATKNVGTTAGTVAAGDDARFGTASTFTGSFTGDVTGTQSATVVATVGGSTATNVHNAELLANSATSFNTASTIVRRDASGDFTARDVSLRSTIYKDSGSKTVTVLSPTALTNSYTLTWPLDKGALNQVLTTDASGNLFWSTPAGGGGGGTVTSVTSGGAPIVVTGTSTDPVIGVSAATTGASGVVTLAADNTTVASTVVQATDSRLSNARAPSGSAGGDLGSTYPNPTVTGIKGAAITYTSLTSGDVLKYNGTAWINTALSTANLSDSSDLLKVSNMPANCAAGSSLTFSSPSGAWVCTTIPDATTSTKGIVQIGTGLSVASGTVSLTSGVATPGTYTKVTVDTYGRVTTTANIAAGDVTTALGYTPVNQAGDVMSGTFGFASYTNATEGTLTAGFGASDKGKTWFNSDLKKINMWDGTQIVSLASPSSPTASEDGKSLRWNETNKSWDYFTAGAAGAGIGTFNTLTANTQNLAIGTSGTLPNWVSATSTHTLNIPMASTSSVTAGLLSKADYDIFNAKLGAASTFTGDVSGTSSTTSVDKIKGKVVTTPTASGQMLVYDGTGITPVIMSSDATMAASGAVTLKNTGTAGTYYKVTTDAQGRVSSGAASLVAADIPTLDWTKITGTPTTLLGYGIADAVKNAGGTPSVQQGTFASMPAAGTSGRLYVTTDTKKLYRDNGTSWDVISPATAGTVTSVTSGGLPIVVGGTAADPTISVNTASTSATGVVQLATSGSATAGQAVEATDSRLTDARAPSGSAGGDLGSTYPNPTVNGLKGAAITYTSLTSGDVLKYNGTAWVNTALSTANLSDSSDLLKVSNMPANCSAGSSLTFSSPSGAWVCTTIPDATTSTKGIVQIGTGLSVASGTVSLTSGVATPGTYTKVTVDTYGRVTTTANISSSDVTTALGFTPVSNAGGAPSMQEGTFASMPAAGTAGKLYVTTDTKKLYRDNGTTWDVISPTTAGTVTSVTSGGLPIVVGGTAADPTISVNTASTSATGVVQLATSGSATAGQAVEATDSRLTDARAPSGSAGGDLGSTYPNPTVNGIKGAAITYTSLISGDFLKYNGSAWINTALSSANLSDSSDLLKVSNMPANCAAGSSLTFSSPSGAWVCTALPVGSTSTAGIVQLATSGSATAGRVVEATDSRLTDARAPSGTAGGDLSSTYPNPTVSKINGVGLSYASLASGDYLKYDGTNWVNATLPAGASYWTAATGGINYAGGNVGIGTTSPGVPLDVKGDSSSIAIQIRGRSADNLGAMRFVSNDGATEYSAFQGGPTYLALFTNSSERMRISSAGKVGIGTTSPSTTLQVENSANPTFFVGSGAYPASSSYGSGLNVDVANGVSYFDTHTQAAGANVKSLIFRGGHGSGETPYTREIMTLKTDSGNVGINTTAPIATMDVNGAVVVRGSGTNGGSIYFSKGATPTTLTSAIARGPDAGAYTGIWSSTAGYGLVMLDTGNVGIGTTAPSYKLHVVGSAGLSTGTAWTLASDRRLKDIDGDYEYGLDEILKLHTVRFHYKKDNALSIPSDKAMTGFVAQEVREVIPDAVHKRDDGYLELNADPIHWAVVNAIKELYQKWFMGNQELNIKIDELKAENAKLKAELERQRLDFDDRLKRLERAPAGGIDP